MNLRQPLNVWRSYLDLFANLVGVIAIGGAGLMAMVGGAVATAGPGAAAWPLDCRNGMEMDSTRLLHPVEGRRAVIDAGQTCQREAVYGGITFPDEGFGEDQWDRSALRQACDDLAGLVKFRRDHNVEGMTIELVGRSTPDWGLPDSCGTRFSRDQKVRKGVALRLNGEERKVIEQDVERRASAEPEAGVIDRSTCNRKLEYDRSRALYAACASEALERDPDLARLVSQVETVPGGGVDSDLVDVACRKTGGVGDDCLRTVSIRVRLPPRGIPWAPPQQASPDG